MKIANIVPHRRFEDKVVLIMDDNRKCVISLEAVYKKSLKKNMEISEEDYNSLEVEENFRKAKQRALWYIESGEKPYKQIYDYLLRKEYSDAIIKRVMDFMVEFDFVNDDRYAKNYIRCRKDREGKMKIRYALKSKGINDEIISEHLESIEDEDIINGIKKIIDRKIKPLINSGKDEYHIKNKLYSYIVSKGFSGEHVSKAINEAIIENKEVIEASIKEKEDTKPEIMEIAQKRYERLKRSEDNFMKLKKKLYDFLLRKGYSYDDIKTTVRTLMEE